MTDDDDILTEAKERFRRCEAWESKARENALADARFANGDAYNNDQWPQGLLGARNEDAKPCLTSNKTRQHNLHVINDARQHKAAIKVTPTGQGATFEAAEVFSAIIRRIEYQSKAMDAYSTAIYHQVESGIGYVRVETDYADEDSFDQEIWIRRVKDPRDIYLDPDAHEYDKGDMRFAFYFTDTPRKEFKARYPDLADEAAAFDNADDWNSEDHVREAEYWRRGEKTSLLHEMMDGSVVRDRDLPAGASKDQLPIKRSRKVAEPEVEWFRIVGNKIVERKTWPGKYIPIVPFIGEEIVIDGQMDRKGHTRALIHPQQMLNYWISEATAQVALQTKAPYVGMAEAIEGQDHWHNANTANVSVLTYNGYDDAGQKLERPQREPPPQMAQAYVEGIQIARQDMMEVSGQYQAEMGAPGNERSGTAIQQRQREGETATYHYIDNQAKGIRQVGRICLDLIPKIYDVPRVTKIMAEDGSESDVHVEPDFPVPHQHVMPPAQPGAPPQPVTPEQADAAQNNPEMPDPRVIFNPQIGRYDVEADVGPQYATQRQEAFNAISQIIQAQPDLVHVAGDLLFKSADFPLADELSERLKRGVPPQYLGGPSPQVQQLQQQLQQVTQHGQTVAQQADAQVAHLTAQVAILKEQAKDKSADVAVRDYEAETKRLAAVGAIDPASLQIIVRQMVEEMMGTQLTPMLQRHAAIEQSMQAPDASQEPPQPDPMAAAAQSHQQMLDRAKLGLQAQQQQHDQAMDIAQHGLAVQQANQPPAPAAAS